MMRFKGSIFVWSLFLIIVVLSAVKGGQDQRKVFIDWASLKNPILSVPDRMLKDQAVVYRGDGWFFIFASTRFDDHDPERFTKQECFYRTRDFNAYECLYDPDLKVSWDKVKTVPNPGSPDVTHVNGLWHMVFQSGPGGRSHRLFCSTSKDLVDLTPAQALAPDNQPRMRHIDGALAFQDGYYYLGYKGKQKFYVTRSNNKALDGQWLKPRRASAGGAWAENYQFIKIDGTWRMIATARDPNKSIDTDYTGSHEPFIYTMDGDGSELTHWTRWVDKRRLEVPYEDWNRVMHANSAYLCDWREHDGYFYLFYAGANDSESFERRGHGKIGAVRSRDLANWRLPGDTTD